MKAYLKNKFKKGFILSEENIIKLNDIISKRIKENYPDKSLNFKIHRIDALVYETSDYTKIVDEENSYRNLISNIEIYIKDDDLKISLSFDKKEDTTLEIEATEKDFAYLLFSDIKEYLNTEVLKCKSFSFTDKRYERLLMPITLIIMLIIILFTFNKGKLTDLQYQELINSESIHEKLNYLINYSHDQNELKNGKFMIILIIVITILSYSMSYGLEKLFPRNIFYLGKEIMRYDKLCSTRSKLLWGVFIACFVSVIAGFIVYYFTK